MTNEQIVAAKLLAAIQNREFIRKLAEREAATMTDSELLQYADLFAPWISGKTYLVDDIFSYGRDEANETILYRVLRQHVSQSNMLPPTQTILYQLIGYVDGVKIWVKPFGPDDAYNVGDIVSHNGVLYINEQTNNQWEPGVYGWAVHTA